MNHCDFLCGLTIKELRASSVLTWSWLVLSGFLRKIDITDQQITTARIGAIEGETIDDDTGGDIIDRDKLHNKWS